MEGKKRVSRTGKEYAYKMITKGPSTMLVLNEAHFERPKPKMRHKLDMNKTIHYFWKSAEEFIVDFNPKFVKMVENKGKNQIWFTVTWPKVKE